MIALPPLKLRRKTRSLAPGAAAVLLSSAVHAAILLPLIGLAWHAPGHEPEPEPARIVEVTLAWAAPAAPMPEPTPEPPAMAQPPTRIVPAAPAPRRPRPATLPAPHEAVPPLPAPPTETSGAPTTTVSEATQAPLTVAPNPQPPSGEMMAGYARQLLARLEQYKRYPALSLRRGEEGTVTIRLTLAADGRLVEIHPVDDAPARLIEASLTAVRDAAPFPPLPSGLRVAEAVFTLPISYRLR